MPLPPSKPDATDLIPQIREELGPDAIILRQREGLTGGVGGFFAQKCVEVDAQAPQPLVDIYDEHDVDQSLLDEIEDPYGDPVPEVTLELPALESGEIAYEPIEPIEPIDLANIRQNGARSARWPQAAQPVECRFARVIRRLRA